MPPSLPQVQDLTRRAFLGGSAAGLGSLALGTIGSVGMWSCVVALPAIQKDFGVLRADASLPFTLTMVGFGGGGILMGRLADRFHILVPVIVGGAIGAFVHRYDVPDCRTALLAEICVPISPSALEVWKVTPRPSGWG